MGQVLQICRRNATLDGYTRNPIWLEGGLRKKNFIKTRLISSLLGYCPHRIGSCMEALETPVGTNHVSGSRAEPLPTATSARCKYASHNGSLDHWIAFSRSDAAESTAEASFSSTFPTTTICLPASPHCRCSMASRTDGSVFTPYPV